MLTSSFPAARVRVAIFFLPCVCQHIQNIFVLCYGAFVSALSMLFSVYNTDEIITGFTYLHKFTDFENVNSIKT
jgi:hypothetical protein